MLQRIIFTIIATLSLLSLSARELKVESFRLLPDDKTAQINPVKDLNGDDCALVKVKTDLTGCVFDGAIGEVKYQNGAYNVYLSPGTRRLGIKCNDHDNLTVEFGNISDIKTVQSSACYNLKLSSIDNSKAIDLSSLDNNNRGLKVTKLEPLQTDISARTKERYDAAGNRCALIKVALPIPACEFEGNIGSADFHINEYWVYLSPDQTDFVLKCPGFEPLNISTKSLLSEITSGQTYKLSLSGFDTSLVKFTDEFANALKRYNNIEPLNDGFFKVEQNGLYGVINLEGKVVIPCKYDNINDYKEGFFSVEKNKKGNIVDTQGSEIFPWKYESVSYSSNGLFYVSNNTNRRGYINIAGEEIIPCIYHFRYIDKIGNLILAEDDNGKTLIYDIKNKKTISGANSLGVRSLFDLTPVYIEPIDHPSVFFYVKSQDDLYTLINEKGEKVSPDSYTDIFYSSNPNCWADNGTLMVKRDGKWGYVNEYGKEIITPSFDDATPFRNGYAMVYQRGKGIEIINKRGQILANFGPTHVIEHYEGGDYSPEWYADDKIQGLIIKKNYKYGIIDRTGKNLIQCIYDEIIPANENLLIVEKNGKKGYISSNSKEVTPCIYDDCENFKNGYAKVKRYGKYGLINKDGEVVIPIKFDNIGDFINGIALVNQNGRSGIVNIKGEEVWFKN